MDTGDNASKITAHCPCPLLALVLKAESRPENLSDAELEVYEQIVNKMDHMGVLVITDEKTIERDAHTYVRYWTAAKFVRKNGETFPITQLLACSLDSGVILSLSGDKIAASPKRF